MVLITESKGKSVVEALGFLSGLLVFFWFFKQPSALKYFSLAGMLLSSAIIAMEIKSIKDLARIFDLGKISEKGWYLTVISLLMGIVWAMCFRDYLDIPLFPSRVTSFALTAMLIGTAEELVFRGYIQQKLRNLGVVISIMGTSALHTFYKCFIFLILPALYPTDYFLLAFWTFSLGSILGVLKEYARNTWVPVSGHALFDLMVYGDQLVFAWWVWQ